MMRVWLFLAALMWYDLSEITAQAQDSISISENQNDDMIRLGRFQKDFQEALKDPAQIKRMGKVYADDLMRHIAYTELGPSFVAFVDLHQALYRYIKGIDPQDLSISSSIRCDFQKASDKFFAQVSKLSTLKNIDSYADQLNMAYKTFLVGFMKKHQAFFESHFRHSLEIFKGIYGYGLDVIDCAFFALKEGWPGYETNDHKYQFEQLYAYRCEDGRILILGYSDRSYVCNRLLHIYIWNMNKRDTKPIQLTHIGANFDLSPQSRSGGCGYLVEKLFDVVHFDGRYLNFSGYDYAVHKNYTYDVKTNVWQIKEGPSDQH